MSKKSFIVILPTFMLRSIDPKRVADKYFQGNFKDVKKDERVETKIISSLVIVPIDSTVNDPIFYYKDKNGKQKVMVFTNQEEYQNYLNGIELQKECRYCGISFNSNEHESTIPLHPENRIIKSGIISLNIPILWGDRTFCDDRCAYKEYIEMCGGNYFHSSFLYNRSEILLKQIHEQKYPGTELKAANDRRLLKKYGGSLSYEEWKSTNYSYAKNSSWLIVPTKIGFERLTSK